MVLSAGNPITFVLRLDGFASGRLVSGERLLSGRKLANNDDDGQGRGLILPLIGMRERHIQVEINTFLQS